MPWGSERYAELEEAPAVLTPLHPTTMLKPEHFSTPLSQLRYPVKLDFSHERFRLRSLALLSQLKETALQEIDLSDNELQSLTELSRFSALKTLCARRNSLTTGTGVLLNLHRLARLDVSDNRLASIPPLKDVPQVQVREGHSATISCWPAVPACLRTPNRSCRLRLVSLRLHSQVLNISRNRIADGWNELTHCTNLQALDASQNQLDWDPDTGELRQAMVVLRGLKRLRVLNLSQNPTSFHKGYRAWVLANARRLEVFDNEGVSEAERDGDDVASRVVEPSAGRRVAQPDDANTSKGGTRKTFGVPLHEVLELDVSTLPRLVQECTRHVQERSPTEGAVLTADGDPSLVMQLRNAFERGGDAGQMALVECMADDNDADVRAACSLLRSFLLELPQPVVPVDYFLPLLEAASGRGAHGGRAKQRGAQLEEILTPMPHENWALFEHLLCFLVNVSRPFAGETDTQELIARVWAPCVLRAPARTMSQFQGKVIDAMASAVLSLLEVRRGGAERGMLEGAPSPARSPRPEDQPPAVQLIDIADTVEEDEPMSHVSASELPDMLARERASADELLSALEELQDDCSLLDDAPPSAPMIQNVSVEPPRSPVRPPTTLQSPPARVPSVVSPTVPSTLPSPAFPAPRSNFMLEAASLIGEPTADERVAAFVAPPRSPSPPAPSHLSSAMPVVETAAFQTMPPRWDEPMPKAFDAPQPTRWSLGLTPREDDDVASTSRLSTSSHKMAMAATAALEAREAEASKLKQRAQRLLRERSELALDLEGLQDTLTRMERAVSRAREQTLALRNEKSKGDSSDTRRHSAQISTLSKAVLREKQRRLSARNEVGALQRQLAKKRVQHHALVERVSAMTRERDQMAEAQAQAEGPVIEAERLQERLEQCRQAIAQVDAQEQRASESAQSEELRRVEAELESRLARLRRAASQQGRPRAPPSATPSVGERRLSQLAEQNHSLRQVLAAEQAHAHGAAPALEASNGTWAQLARRLEDELTEHQASVPASANAVSDAAKWHAEARAFAAEVRRVEHLHAQAAARKRDEREGWRDFMQETARTRQRHATSTSAAASDDGSADASLRLEVAQAREALRVAVEDADTLVQSGGVARMRLDEAGTRLAGLRSLMAELQHQAGL